MLPDDRPEAQEEPEILHYPAPVVVHQDRPRHHKAFHQVAPVLSQAWGGCFGFGEFQPGLGCLTLFTFKMREFQSFFYQHYRWRRFIAIHLQQLQP